MARTDDISLDDIRPEDIRLTIEYFEADPDYHFTRGVYHDYKGPNDSDCYCSVGAITRAIFIRNRWADGFDSHWPNLNVIISEKQYDRVLDVIHPLWEAWKYSKSSEPLGESMVNTNDRSDAIEMIAILKEFLEWFTAKYNK